MVAAWRCAIPIRPAARSCGLPVGSGRRSPLETDAASSTAKNIAHYAGLTGPTSTNSARTPSPRAARPPIPPTTSRARALEVYGDSAYGTAAARVMPTVPVGTTP